MNKPTNKPNNLLINDLNTALEYAKGNDNSGYAIIITNKDRQNYYVAYDCTGNPNDILASLELTLLEIKMTLIVMNNKINDKYDEYDDTLTEFYNNTKGKLNG